MSAPTKWTCRKYGNHLWLVWRPGQSAAVTQFQTGAEALAWRPDCDRFLQGYCNCRFECAR